MPSRTPPGKTQAGLGWLLVVWVTGQCAGGCGLLTIHALVAVCAALA